MVRIHMRFYNINPDLFVDIEDLAEGVEAYMEGYKDSIRVFWQFLDMFLQLMPYEDIPNATLSHDQKNKRGVFNSLLVKIKRDG